ncbi:MAG TPA: MarR family transcriptional regulator [Fimbriimonadaceae bacterium]|nr:MarR family transcriptional regulator [Fimbriimonadaceae bacterium]
MNAFDAPLSRMSRETPPQPSVDEAVLTYVELVRAAEALHASVSRGLAAEGLTASQFSTLKVLKHRGSLPQKEIASYLLKTGGNVTVVVDNLERAGLVRRDRDTKDRRLVLVTISESGAELFDRIYPAHLDRIKGVMRPLDATQLEELMALLKQLHASVVRPVCLPDEDSNAKPAARRRAG